MEQVAYLNKYGSSAPPPPEWAERSGRLGVGKSSYEWMNEWMWPARIGIGLGRRSQPGDGETAVHILVLYTQSGVHIYIHTKIHTHILISFVLRLNHIVLDNRIASSSPFDGLSLCTPTPHLFALIHSILEAHLSLLMRLVDNIMPDINFIKYSTFKIWIKFLRDTSPINCLLFFSSFFSSFHSSSFPIVREINSKHFKLVECFLVSPDPFGL